MRLIKLLVGLDFTEPSLAAARWLARCLGPEAELVLVHVVTAPERPGFLEDVLPPAEELLAGEKRQAEDRIRELERSLEYDRTSTMISVGRPADEIARLAQESGADMIAVAQHRLRGRGGATPGSTAEQLLRSASVPVFLARDLPEPQPRRILIPLDESGLTQPVLGWARLLAERFGSSVTAFHALSSGLVGSARIARSVSSVDESAQELRVRTERWLEERLESAGLGDVPTELRVGFGDPAYEIVAAARDVEADLVVMGSRGAGVISPTLLGSKAAAVIRWSDLPLLVATGGSGS